MALLWLRLRLFIVAGVLSFWAVALLLRCLGDARLFWSCVRDFLGPSIFILLCVGGMPEESLGCASAEAPNGWVRASCVLVMLLATGAVSAYPWVAVPDGKDFCEGWRGPEVEVCSPGLVQDDDSLGRHRVDFFIASISGWIITVIAMFCVGRSHQPSLYIRSGVRFQVAAWLQGITWMLVKGISICGNPEDYFTCMGSSAGKNIGYSINSASVIWASFLIVRAIAVLETGTSEGPVPVILESFTQQLVLCFGTMCVLQLGGNIFSAIAFVEGQSAYDICGGCAFLLASVAMVVCLQHVLSAFQRPVKILFDEARKTSDIIAAEALWAGQCLRLERKVIVTSMVLAVCDLTMRAITGIFGNPINHSMGGHVCSYTLWGLREILDVVSIAVLCGFFGKSKIEGGFHQPARDELVQTLNKEKYTLARHPASSDRNWHRKVEELAGRGFPLAALLDFFEELLQGDVMPSFDPLRSTTNDVVRQAVIPLSRSHAPLTGGRALASVWSGGVAVWPERFVTHAWSSLHLHLIAAIAADALGVEVYYNRLAMQLCSVDGLRGVRRQLEANDGHLLTYWVCAFSVNQHVGICGGFGDPPRNPIDHEKWMQRRVDTVSGKPHPQCDCSEPKFCSNEPVQCEMNKFDDMLDLLVKRKPSFRHVIAMDENFDLLKRCWCLAEIVQTSSTHAPQNTLMFSAESMDSHYDALRDIDVQECEASNEQDRKFILKKIPSISHFNAKLKQLVFNKEGIFNRQLKCPCDRMQAAARFASRVDKSRTSRSRLHMTAASATLTRASSNRPSFARPDQRLPAPRTSNSLSEDLEGTSEDVESTSV